MKPFLLHYTNGFTGYGPITADRRRDFVFYPAQPLCSRRGEIFSRRTFVHEPARKRHRVSEHLVLSDDEALQSRTCEVIETAIEPEDDGLAAWFLRARQAPKPMRRVRQMGAGSISSWRAARCYTMGVLPELSCVYVSADSEPMPLEAGVEGLEVLIAQFPTAEPISRTMINSRQGRKCPCRLGHGIETFVAAINGGGNGIERRERGVKKEHVHFSRGCCRIGIQTDVKQCPTHQKPHHG